jgi:hypothetical protein
MKPPHHLERQRSLAVEHFMDPIAAAHERDQVARRQSLLLHVVFDGRNRVGQVKRIVLGFPSLDQGDENIESIPSGVPRFAIMRPSISLRTRR